MLDLTELVNIDVTVAYVWYAVLLIVKMMLMGPLTGMLRTKKKAFVNPEDTAPFGKGENAKKVHLNDLENIVPFLFIGFFYSFSGVSLSTALLHYRIFFGSRVFHTITYLLALPQPSRALSFLVGYLITFSMIYKLVMVGLSMS
ncbi:hypothetical protein JD844_028771 [Phrynosoma platyrhinos]|uniref:Microsomal glutathione S-transferase 1 n=1 Tax=Phrynosoma platyrhinos TaxID=52577 RepID=A0ABQ7SIJ8_PHRPL|nr:hypothetical protein JD844_028771 [Phrynosoma platyrhinos]